VPPPSNDIYNLGERFMPPMLLYLITCMIWGSTWLAIHYQVHFVTPVWSVCYRFLSAALILFAICALHRRTLRFPLSVHACMAIQGLTLFSLSYICIYFASMHLVSGLVSLLSALTLVFNIINARIFLGTYFRREVIVGCLLGIIGLVIIFVPDLSDVPLGSLSAHAGFIAIMLAALGALLTSFGNILSKHMQNRTVPILQSNAFGMFYGSVSSACVAWGLGEPWRFSFDPLYLGSLAYLSIFGSVIAFSCYIKLIGTMGPERVAYVGIVTPLLAMTLSTLFEGFHWTWYDVLGISLALLGNLLLLKRKV